MKKLIIIGFAFAFGASPMLTPAQAADAGPPLWAWAFVSRDEQVTPVKPGAGIDPTMRYKLPGSKFSFTWPEVWAAYSPADWFPEEHPQMPDIVAVGRRSANPPISACGLCHLPDGRGRPENANLTGLSYDYIMQQLMDFRNGLRQTSDPRKTNTATMTKIAEAMTEPEMSAAAKYYSEIPAKPTIKVVEGAVVPKTRNGGGTFHVLTGAEAGVEALGKRIIETPVNEAESEIWRSPHSGFIAYVPPGSLRKGKNLVMRGAGKTDRCTVCHGIDLRGLGPVPRLAGLAPSYIVRQLYDMQHGNRTGTWSPLMASAIADLDTDDLMNAAAYLASLDP
jgi:cytochrome c553